MKNQTDTSKFAGQDPKSTGATGNPANNNNFSNYNPAPGDKSSSILSSEGAIGSAFKADGAIGSMGQAVGGPLAADGMIGKNFTEHGAVGGSINSAVGGTKKD